MTKTKRQVSVAQKACGHNWGTGWQIGAGAKMKMQVRRCLRCDLMETRKDPRIIREKLDITNVAAFLSDGWRRYTHLFGATPNGTIRQFQAMLELSYMDQWRTVSVAAKEGKATT